METRAVGLKAGVQGPAPWENLLETQVLGPPPRPVHWKQSGRNLCCLSLEAENKGLTEKTPSQHLLRPGPQPHLLPDRGITLSRSTSAPWNGRVTKSDLKDKQGPS